MDTMRGWDVTSGWKRLNLNLTAVEDGPIAGIIPDASGFSNTVLSQQHLYIAIRRPNKPVTDATKVFCPVARGALGITNVNTPGFPADTVLIGFRNAAAPRAVYSRLRGSNMMLATTNISAESTYTAVGFDNINGYQLTSNAWNDTYQSIDHAFKRALGFFDEVCVNFTSTGQQQIKHNLGAPPGMIWMKARNGLSSWYGYHKALGATKVIDIQSSNGEYTPGWTWGTVSAIEFGFSGSSGYNMDALLFGDTPGLCKAGSFTHSGSSVTVDCGFNPRLVMLKRTDAAGDWYIWDSARGIVAGNDPYLLLNSTAAEVTSTDHIDPTTGGFIINPTLPAGTYVYWACA